jgi:hypothetical protein
LEDPHTGQRRAFATLDKLVDYLMGVTQPGLKAGEPEPLVCEPGQSVQPDVGSEGNEME